MLHRKRNRSIGIVIGLALQAGSAWGAPPMAAQISAAIEMADLQGVALDDLGMGGRVQIHGVHLATSSNRAAARDVTLDLERFSVANPGAMIFAEGPEGKTPIDISGVVLLKGSIAGEPGSVAYVGISSAGVHGFVRAAEGMYSVTSGLIGADGQIGEVVVTHVADLPVPDGQVPSCGFHPRDPRLVRMAEAVVREGADAGRGSRAVCRSVDIAIDTDWEFTSAVFGGNTIASAQYALTLLGGVGQIYQSEVDVRLTTNYVRVWSADVDPYNQGGDLLDEFAGHWSSTKGSVPRELAHIFSGRRNLGYGGVAYLSAICESYGYGVSGYLDGTFPSPLQNRNPGNWDLMVVAHEIGHNFGTGHTHDSYNPPIDGCGAGNCAGAVGGTIMSYCHTCPGGMSNIDLVFGPRVRDVILSYLDSRPCVLNSQGDYVAVDDAALAIAGGQVAIPVLDNDSDVSCLAPSIVSHDSASTNGGTIAFVSPSPSTDQLVRPYLLYTAPVGTPGVDTFTYTINGGATATVFVDVVEPLAPEVVVDSATGVRARYYAIAPLSVLPNFDALPSYGQATFPSVNFASTEGNFATSGRADNVGAVFEGYVTVPTSAVYTLSTSSDDGSKLYVNGTLVVDNDGLHGMQSRSGDIALGAGPHKVRIDFFERGGGAGVIASIQGGGLAQQVIPPSMWSRPCPSDANRNGTVDVLDFLDYLNAFSACEGSAPPCTVDGIEADFNANGVIDVIDLLDFIDALSAGC